jgi:PiT family inorganic phosphate transporter
MQDLLIFLSVLMAAALGWSIGANDAANSLGTAVGSKVVTLRQAIFLISVVAFLGAILQGGYVTKTIGNKIIPMYDLPTIRADGVTLGSVLAACVWVVVATYWKIPVSTSHAIVGAVA